MRLIYLGLAGALGSSGVFASIANKISGVVGNIEGSLLPSDVKFEGTQAFKKHNESLPSIAARYLFSTRQEAGRCGADFAGARCTDNQCCSAYGYCGTAFEHCAVIVGCQPQYGRCGDAPPETTTSTTSTSTSTTSTTSTSVTTTTSTITSTTSTQPPAPTGTLIISPNGQCGNSTTCAGSGFGGCCSEFYFCGDSIDYCGAGCHAAFGTCGGQPPTTSPSPTTTSTSSTSSTTAPPTTTSTSTSSTSSTTTTSAPPPAPTNVSTDGKCGTNSKTCTGSTYGRCCSSYGWCGSQDDYCRVSWGCQTQWGECGDIEFMGRM